MLKLYDLTTECKREPLGLDEAQPRFGRTNYRKRLQYRTCAVTLHSGKKPSGADAGERLVQGQARLYAAARQTV